jgi:hypothetical protein
VTDPDRVSVTTRRRARRRGLLADDPAPVTPALPPRGPAPVDDAPFHAPYVGELYGPLAPELTETLPIPADERTPGWRPWPLGLQQRWRLYFIYGRLPAGAVWWLRMYDWVASLLFGPQSYLLYVGQTGQYVPLARGLNHVIRKSWAPDIVSIELGTATYESESAAEKAEKKEIQRRRPLHNIAHNVGNPRAADSAMRKLPRHRRAARRRAMWSLSTRLSLTALVWWALVSMAPYIEAVHRAVDSAGGRTMIIAWAAALIFGAGRLCRSVR